MPTLKRVPLSEVKIISSNPEFEQPLYPNVPFIGLLGFDPNFKLGGTFPEKEGDLCYETLYTPSEMLGIPAIPEHLKEVVIDTNCLIIPSLRKYIEYLQENGILITVIALYE